MIFKEVKHTLDIFETLQKLCAVPAVSGFEHTAARRAALLLERFTDEVFTDPLGNVIGIRRSGNKNAKTLLLDAHIDEIGLIVSGYEGDFLRFETVGGVDVRMLPAREVLIMTEPVTRGVITCLPPHIQSREDMDKSIPKDSLYIDTGIKNVREHIAVGTPVVYNADCVKLQNGFISGRALDDRAGFVSLLLAMHLLRNKHLNIDIAVLGSVQEEVGCRGATVGSYTVNPDYAIAVDVTHGTTPDAGKPRTFDCGSGVAIGLGPNINRSISDTLKKIARDKKIAHTLEVMEGETGTNAWPIQVAREGIPTGLLSIPLRYMHTPFETLCEKDVQKTARLISEFILHLSAEVSRDA